MLCEARILVCIGDDEEFALANGMAAEKIRIGYLAKVEAMRRFEEQAVRVHQAHQRYRRFADGRREAGQIVEPGLAAGFEHAIAAQSRKTRALLRARSKTSRLRRDACAFDHHLRFLMTSRERKLTTSGAPGQGARRVRACRENRDPSREIFPIEDARFARQVNVVPEPLPVTYCGLRAFRFPQRAVPHTSIATSTTRSNFRRCTSSEIGFPRNVLAKPHWGLRHRFSSGTIFAAASMRRFSASFDSSSGTFVLSSPSTILLRECLGKKRSGSKPPERSSSYSRKYASTSTLLSRTSATGS